MIMNTLRCSAKTLLMNHTLVTFQNRLHSCGGFVGRLSSVPWLLFPERLVAGSSSSAHLLGLADSSNGSQICLFRQSEYLQL